MAAPQQANQSDHSTGILWGTAAGLAAVGTLWYVFKKQLVTFYLLVKLYEIDFFALFTNHFSQDRLNILSALGNPGKLTFNEIVNLGQNVGDFLRFPFVIMLFILAIVVYVGNTTRSFKRNYSMKELAKLERVNWPQIGPIVDLDLLHTDIDKGPWAMAMTPMQFCKRLKLLEEVRLQRKEGISRKDRERVEVVLKRGEANKVFALQLGQLWKGTNKLPPHTRALFAAFAARINADSKAGTNLLAQLSESSLKKLDLSGVDELLKKHENTKQVQKIIQSHGYVLTVMASMLEGSREDGVQAAADFLWVKPVDRRLWYVLNTVGRQTPFIEVAGVFAHWVAEKDAGRKIFVPMIEEATKALEIALADVVYRVEEA